MQMEAEKLKSLTIDGSRTKVVSLGIGSGVSETELNNMASAPRDKNVILVQDFSSLPDVEEQLRNTSCTGRWLTVSYHVVYLWITAVDNMQRCTVERKYFRSKNNKQFLSCCARYQTVRQRTRKNNSEKVVKIIMIFASLSVLHTTLQFFSCYWP